jgi:hypothetical protein
MAKGKLWQPLVLLPILASCSTSLSESQRQQTPSMQVDHVIIGVSNLEAGIREFEQLTGVRAALGGAHPGMGTRNALVSLGEGAYLELYAPNPAEEVKSPTVTELKGFTRLKPVGWAVSTTDVEALRSYLGSLGLPQSPPEPGSRVRPDGSVLEWVTFGFEQFDHPLAPFFIQWKQKELHPSRTSPGGCRLVSIALGDPNPTQLKAAVQPLSLDVPIAQSAEKQMVVRLSCPRGRVTLN